MTAAKVQAAEPTGDNMAIFGNFKGTTQSEFKIGKRDGNKISAGSIPESGASSGDIHIDSGNRTMQIYTGSSWTSVGNTLTDLNVDSGTLFVSSANDTVSIGAVTSNEKLFVNGNLRLGTNPSLQFSGAFLDMRHSNGSTTNIRVRDNTSGTDPIFKVFTADNETEAFKVHGANVVIHESYKLPTSDGSSGQALITDGAGNLAFGTVADPVDDYGSITEAANVTADYGSLAEDTREPTPHDSYTVAEANGLITAVPGDMIFISDETDGPTMAFSDGTNWRRIQDRQIISASNGNDLG